MISPLKSVVDYAEGDATASKDIKPKLRYVTKGKKQTLIVTLFLIMCCFVSSSVRERGRARRAVHDRVPRRTLPRPEGNRSQNGVKQKREWLLLLVFESYLCVGMRI
jgi:hypothetical protein